MRTFLALEIPPDIVDYLGAVTDRLARRTDGVKWVRNAGIHITVKFLGEIEEAMVETMRQVLQPIGNLFAPFAARLGALDAFPSQRSARVIVVKLKEGSENIVAIFSQAEGRLAEIAVEREKRGLVPHITLGRRRIPKPFPNGDPMPIEEMEFLIENLVLFRSTLTQGGAIYAPVWKIKLGGENP
jgi:2'-5' RNA ligase